MWSDLYFIVLALMAEWESGDREDWSQENWFRRLLKISR